MAHIRHMVQQLGKPYLLFHNEEADKFAPVVLDEEDSSKETKQTQPPASWEQHSFQYTSLDPSKKTIRILHLHPGDKDDPVVCSLKDQSVDEYQWPSYNALSYQWGDATSSKAICVNGSKFEVRNNLHSALVQLRSRYEDKVFWIDAICIDQSNLAEKSRQVRLMAEIYRNAVNVITWLGDASQDSDLAMDYLYQYRVLMGYREPGLRIPQPSEEETVALTNLLHRGYWNRVWIMQEVVSGGPRAYIFCGEKWIWWECMDWFRIEQERSVPTSPEEVVPNLMMTQTISRTLAGSQLRDMMRDGACYGSLSELLSFSRGREATYDVDKIYGILAMTGDHIQKQLIPDYTKKPREVLLEATRIALEEISVDQMKLLCEAGHEDANLPSWCPNWTKPSPHTGLPYDAYNASKDLGPQFKFNGDIMEMLVIVVDRVFDVSESIFNGDNWDVVDEMQLVAEGVNRIYGGDSKEPIRPRDQNEEQSMGRKLAIMLSGRFKETFWRTLCANVNASGQSPALKEYGDALRDFRSRLKDPSGGFGPQHPHYATFATAVGAAFTALKGRRLFLIERAFMGIGPSDTKQDDLVIIIPGAKVPFIVRKVDDNYFRFVGPAYVDSIMDGQVIESYKDENGRVPASWLKIK